MKKQASQTFSTHALPLEKLPTLNLNVILSITNSRSQLAKIR